MKNLLIVLAAFLLQNFAAAQSKNQVAVAFGEPSQMLKKAVFNLPGYTTKEKTTVNFSLSMHRELSPRFRAGAILRFEKVKTENHYSEGSFNFLDLLFWAVTAKDFSTFPVDKPRESFNYDLQLRRRHFLANFEYDLVHRKHFALTTGIAIGFHSTKFDFERQSKFLDKTVQRLSGNFKPIGIRIGNRFGVRADVNLGAEPSATGGIFFKW